MQTALAHLPTRKILLVEDDVDLSQALGEILEQRGHEVVTASDGGDGLQRMRECRPDVVVLDLMMPHFDGWQFRIAQRSDPALAGTPVVVISGSSSPTAAAVDADAYLRKPIDAKTLVQAIDNVLDAHQKRLETASVAQTERLAAIGTLAAGLAHEINNPLTYVLLELAHAKRLLSTLATDDNREIVGKVGHLLGDASEGAERIRGITAAIRSFTRPADTSLTPIDIRAPIEAAIKLVINEIRHRATLETQYDHPPVVMANEGRIGQVFLNLLTNAAHAIPDGNPDANRIRVRAGADAQGDLFVEVSDTGVGIPAHLLGRVFEPFFSTKPVGQGTGLGLSISHNIITALGGELTVTSQPGQTLFRMVLPRAVTSR